MQLTPMQCAIRAAFREAVVDLWFEYDKPMLFNVRRRIAERLNIPEADVAVEYKNIPSIGYAPDMMPIHIWCAKYFKPIANALWDKKNKSAILELWRKTKRTKDITPRVPASERKEHGEINKNHKKLRAIAELKYNSADRWGNTAWNKVK